MPSRRPSGARYAALLGYIGGKQFEDEPWKGLIFAFVVAVSLAGVVELVRHLREKRRAGAESPPADADPGEVVAAPAPSTPSSRRDRSKTHAPMSRITSARKPMRSPFTQPPGSSVSPRNASWATQRTRKPIAAATQPQFPQSAQIPPITISKLPDVDDRRESAVRVERALTRTADVRRDREGLGSAHRSR